MRLTESRIRQIIKEEAKRVLSEVNGGMGDWDCEIVREMGKYRHEKKVLVRCTRDDVEVEILFLVDKGTGEFTNLEDEGRVVRVGGRELDPHDDAEEAFEIWKDASPAAEALIEREYRPSGGYGGRR